MPDKSYGWIIGESFREVNRRRRCRRGIRENFTDYPTIADLV